MSIETSVAAAWMVALIVFFISPKLFGEAEPTPPEVITEEDVVYGENRLANGETISRVMDVHHPASSGAAGRPALILLHGNPGKQPYPNGRQHGFRDVAGYFVPRGYVCFVVAWDLRQGHEQAFPQVEMAVSHIRAHAKKYGIAPNRIGVLGSSYGGRHACTLATANFVGEAARVQACVMRAGGMSYPGDCDGKDAPVLLTYGTADPWYRQVPGILSGLREGNVPHAYFELKDGGHGISMDQVLGFGRKQIEIIEDFLAIHLMDAEDTRLKMLSTAKQGQGQIVIGDGPSYGLYPKGTKVTVSAVPAAGAQFIEWRGDIESRFPNADVVMDSNKCTEAVFEDAVMP